MRRWTLAIGLVVALVATACGNSTGDGGAADTTQKADIGDSTDTGEFVSVTAPGVSDTEIRVGGVAAVTNPLGGKYGDAFTGVQAYFDMINSEGGIYERQLVLAEEADDKLVNNKAEVERVINSDVLALMPIATPLFDGADSAVAAGIPTFGWVINPEWEGSDEDPRSNLFGQTGSFLCFTCPGPALPWLAGDLGATKIGVLAYSVPQSTECAEGVQNSFEKYGDAVGAEVAFIDTALSYGVTDVSAQVSRMKDAGVDLITTCMDTNGVVTVAKERKKQGLDAVQYLPNGYDHEFLAEFGDLFEGSVVRTDFVQWDLPEDEHPEGLQKFLEWMEKIGAEPSENAIVGWMNADLFVEGLKAAGPAFSQQKVIDGINKMTEYTAGDIAYWVDWTLQHLQLRNPEIACQFNSVIRDSEFVAEYSEPGKPWICADGTDPSELTGRNEPSLSGS
jgi:ABC-type branched-subunit amino acid transport system substrate-binding protein